MIKYYINTFINGGKIKVKFEELDNNVYLLSTNQELNFLPVTGSVCVYTGLEFEDMTGKEEFKIKIDPDLVDILYVDGYRLTPVEDRPDTYQLFVYVRVTGSKLAEMIQDVLPSRHDGYAHAWFEARSEYEDDPDSATVKQIQNLLTTQCVTFNTFQKCPHGLFCISLVTHEKIIPSLRLVM